VSGLWVVKVHGDSTKEDHVYDKMKVRDGEKWQKLNVEQDPNTRDSRVTPSARVPKSQGTKTRFRARPLIR